MRIYDYLNGIRGALGSGEDTGVPEPAWRIEEYLKDIYDAIKAGGGGSGLPDTPGSDGTYALQNTVESGTGTLSWASGGGGGSGALVATVGGLDFTLDKTWQEIFDAATAGVPIIIRDEPTETNVSYGYIFINVSTYGSTYTVQALFSGNTFTFNTDSADGYPVLNM